MRNIGVREGWVQHIRKKELEHSQKVAGPWHGTDNPEVVVPEVVVEIIVAI